MVLCLPEAQEPLVVQQAPHVPRPAAEPRPLRQKAQGAPRHYHIVRRGHSRTDPLVISMADRLPVLEQ